MVYYICDTGNKYLIGLYKLSIGDVQKVNTNLNNYDLSINWDILLYYCKYYQIDILYSNDVICIKKNKDILNNIKYLFEMINKRNLDISKYKRQKTDIYCFKNRKHIINKELFFEWCDKYIIYNKDSKMTLDELTYAITSLRNTRINNIGSLLYEYLKEKDKNIPYKRCNIDNFKKQYWIGIKYDITLNVYDDIGRINLKDNIFLYKHKSKNHYILNNTNNINDSDFVLIETYMCSNNNRAFIYRLINYILYTNDLGENIILNGLNSIDITFDEKYIYKIKYYS